MDVGFHGFSLGSVPEKGRVGYSEERVSASVAGSGLERYVVYPQNLWINLWKEIERVV
jgi:hypothetical protein